MGRLSSGLYILLLSCTSGKQKPPECYYETVKTLAEVINIKPHPTEGKDGRILVMLDFKASVLALEDQELGNLMQHRVDHAYLERNNITLGYKYEVEVTELTKGDCETKLTVAFLHKFE